MWAYSVRIDRTADLSRSAMRAILGLAVAMIVAANSVLVGPAALQRDQPAAGWSLQGRVGGAAAAPAADVPADVPADWWAAVQEDLQRS